MKGGKIKTKIKNIIIGLNSVSLIVILLFSPLTFLVYNFSFYNKLYEKNGVYEILARYDTAKITGQVFEFFKSGKEFENFKLKGNISYFNDTEISHLLDVKILLNKIFVLFYCCLAVFLILAVVLYLIDKKIYKFLRGVSLMFLISSSVFIFFALLLYFFGNNFFVLFEKFHLIFFPQGNWAFPEGSLIITIFPFGFFYDFFFKLILNSLIIALVLFACGLSGVIVTKKINDKLK
jgi:integral membrane protein (TIGR01906 family)